jgi:hypothetical protein
MNIVSVIFHGAALWGIVFNGVFALYGTVFWGNAIL